VPRIGYLVLSSNGRYVWTGSRWKEITHALPRKAKLYVDRKAALDDCKRLSEEYTCQPAVTPIGTR
jgi:hypothetical protein